MEALLALLFGLLIGSFLNVCIYRWPRDLSVVRPRSHCPACEKPIAAWDNIPLVSYVMLAGKCRQCGARISPRYPFVEFATGALFFYFVTAFGPTALAAKLCCLSAMLLALIVTDFEERILPDEFTIGCASRRCCSPCDRPPMA
jgi:leader peptidase (prepilin peptidase)/N-methyltransferase